MTNERLSLSLVERKLNNTGLRIFTVSEFSKFLEIKSSTARAFLSRNSKKQNSYFLKIKKGLYIFAHNLPNKFEIANKLYKPSYISFETALSFYGIIPENVYSIISATTKQTKSFSVQRSFFDYIKIKKSLFFGYQPQKMRGVNVLMAEREKALLDYIYLLSLRKKDLNDRVDLSKIDDNKLGYYVKYFKNNLRKNKSFINLIKIIYKPI
ncbi:MAG: hypothetical protein WC302_00115 [Candidatus Paceibacterota bacterium]|jgi:predicted transcriptional regulator of viral defense system